MIVACLLYSWAILQTASSPFSSSPAFAVTNFPRPSAEEQRPFFSEGFITPSVHGMTVHSGSICELSGGILASVWYGGSREGGQDVCIYFSSRSPGEGGEWNNPKSIVSRDSASEELNRYIKKVGNPVIFSNSGQKLWLLYVSVSLGGWSGSSLNLKTSEDCGITWSRSVRLILNPFFNVSELVRNRPLPLAGGGFAIPIYHEFLGRFPEVLWLSQGSPGSPAAYRKSRMAGGRGYIQPSLVPLDAHNAAAFYRNMTPERSVAMATTCNAGLSWSQPRSVDLPNPNSALHAILMPGGQILMAFNDSRKERENLRLAISDDKGEDWKRIATLENSEGAEFSYPYLVRDHGGLTHLVYTWRRKRIKHIVFNDAWVQRQMKSATP